MTEQDIKEQAIELVGQQIMETGCTSGRQEVEGNYVYWELIINVL